jgi:hypothetical protein
VNSSAGRPFGVNAGSFVDASRDTLAADTAAAAAQIGPALARQAEFQANAALFIAQHGAQVLNGHTEVGTGINMDLEPPTRG